LRPFVDDKGEQDNEDVVVLPPELFVKTAIRVFDVDSIFGELDEAIVNTQRQHLPTMKTWQEKYNTTTISTLRPPYGEIPGWRKEGRLAIPPDLSLKRKIMFHIHDAPRRHPNRAATLRQTLQSYWWPEAEEWITKYVDNCERCHNTPPIIRATSSNSTPLRSKIHEMQEKCKTTLEGWKTLHLIQEGQNGWEKDGHSVIPLDEELRQQILQALHDAPTAGHPGQDETFSQVSRNYWWPGMRAWVTNYVAGCATCQQNKNITHRTRTPLYRIPAPENALPFQQIALDLITGLPPNGPHDSILTIVDHGCSRAAVFLPCATTITGPEVAQLYFDNVYRWFGLPSKVISDRDPRFTSHFGRALTNKIGAKQNLSTAFHPQTDGLSEWKNQWVEQYLRLVVNAQQGDWSQWLTVASAVHNDHVNATLGMTPNEALLGYRPTLHPDQNTTTNNQMAEQRLETLHQKRTQAVAAINRVAKRNPTPEQQFKEGDQVWLEASNLKLPYHTPKLAPRRQGPFRVSKVISPVAYQLALPLSWGIHDVFHTSLLLPYKETATHGPNFTRPPPDLIEDEEEYEVETIINHRHHGRQCQLQYLVKWKGYPSSDNTWEPVEGIHAEDLLKEYHRRHPLEMVKSRGGTGTRKLIRALRLFVTTPSPTQKIIAWLRNDRMVTFPLDTPLVHRRKNEYSSTPRTPLWHQPSSESFKKRFPGSTPVPPGDLCKTSHSSCGRTERPEKIDELALRKDPLTQLKVALKKVPPRASSPRTLQWTTPPSNGRGRPL